ncbi:DUF4166 domain-containing protein [Dongia sedimenti]|uniref:DUF4166 domain-containing protein n=1 Tax=Dongia sedimenti TaxID=3064282 RepID=A0ABU0YFR1_9PROT|nr:DUF4166 domain-containing protein [Rhodospirillaceae bacterium R-7]
MFDGGRRRGSFAGGAVAERIPENALIECLDGAFVKLPEIVQRAHRGTIRLSGTANVQRGKGLGGLIAMLLRLPKSNPKAELVVVAWHFSDQMVWSRTFDGRAMESTFRKDDDFLVEQIGPLSLYLQPMCEGGRLVYRLIATQIGPITVPRLLAPSMTAWEGEKDGRYAFEVSVGLPLCGQVIRYSGSLDLEVLAT